MESRRLEIIVHSANGLNDVKHLGTIDPYVVVWIVGSDGVSKKYKTVVAKNSVSPVWDCPMEFNIVPMKSNCILFFDIQHDGMLLDRKIGEVHVPFTSLLVGDASGSKVSYPVKIPSGEVKGEIIISHKFSEPVVSSATSTGKVSDNVKPHKKVKRKKKYVFFKPIVQDVGNGHSHSHSDLDSDSDSDDDDDDDDDNNNDNEGDDQDQSQDQDQGN